MTETISIKKKFIILYGPTGSGKSGVYKEFLKKNLLCSNIDKKCLKDNKYYIGEVDKYVEADPDYQKLIIDLEDESNALIELSSKIQKMAENDEEKKDVLSSIQKSINMDSKIEEIEKTLKKLKESNLSEKMTKIYFDIRNSKGYNLKNEKDILDHMLINYNILFEITGTNTQTIKKICDNNLFESVLLSMTEEKRSKYKNINLQRDYDIIVLVPFTTYKKLSDRIIKRYIKAKKEGAAPRLPPVDTKKLAKDEKDSFDNLLILIKDKCVDKIILYDNNDDNNYTSIKSMEINPRTTEGSICNVKSKLTEPIMSKSFSNFILNC